MYNYKRQNLNTAQPSGESYPHQYDLQTIGMRIRKSVNDGYQTPDNLLASVHKNQEKQQQQQQYANQIQRVPLPSNVVVPPLLSNSSSTMSTYGSNLEEWESNLDNRLNTIQNGLILQKEALSKRRFDAVDNDW